ncbi:glycoside hydrolase, partial [Aureobasidium melanogenum]
MMSIALQFLSLSGLVAVAAAAPAPPHTRTGDPCYVTSYPDLANAVSSCTNITLDSIAVPGNTTLDLTKLKAGTTVTFAGKTTFAYADANYDMIKVAGTDVTITAEKDAIIDGNGQAWWDGLGSNGGVAKPNHFITVSKAIGTSVIKNLVIQNYPVHCFSISGSNGLVVENILLNNTAGDAPNNRSNGLAAAHNTDGFDISSIDGMLLRDSRVLNQDDCVAVTSGNNITVSNMYCDGGHGLSIGSVGGKSNNNVTNILFENSKVLNSQNGARIKTNSGTTGYIANIEYRNIQVSNISIYGIDIQQDYLNGGPTGIPTNGVIIKNITMSNVRGIAQKKARDYYILCGDDSCSDFTFNNIHITGGTNNSCNVEPTSNFQFMVTTNQLLNKNTEKDCIAVTADRKYYQTKSAFVKRSLRPQEWQASAFLGKIIVPRLGEERLLNEAAELEFVAANTNIPVPIVLACFEDDSAVYLITELIDARSMDGLSDSDRAVVAKELETYIDQLHGLRSSSLGGCTGLAIPPYRVWEKTPRDEWKFRPSDAEEYVFCHMDLSQQNVLVCHDALKIKAIVDWEYSGFWPEKFEKRFYERLGPSVALEGEVDDVDEILSLMIEKLMR